MQTTSNANNTTMRSSGVSAKAMRNSEAKKGRSTYIDPAVRALPLNHVDKKFSKTAGPSVAAIQQGWQRVERKKWSQGKYVSGIETLSGTFDYTRAILHKFRIRDSTPPTRMGHGQKRYLVNQDECGRKRLLD